MSRKNEKRETKFVSEVEVTKCDAKDCREELINIGVGLSAAVFKGWLTISPIPTKQPHDDDQHFCPKHAKDVLKVITEVTR